MSEYRETSEAKNMKNDHDKLAEMTAKADKREMNDDHLSTEERKAYLKLFKKCNPNYKLSDDLDEAYTEALWG